MAFLKMLVDPINVGHSINSCTTTLNITRSGKIKVPEWFDLVNTNNRLIFKLNVNH